MGEIVHLPLDSSPKYGFKKVKKRKANDLEKYGQLNLFKATPKVFHLHSQPNLFEKALALDEKSDPKAEAMYRQAIEAGDCVADAYCNLGIWESGNGNQDGALESFTNSLKYDAAHFETHYNLGNLYFENSNYEPAKVHYKIAIEIDPFFPNGLFNLGLVYALPEEYDKAHDTLMEYKNHVSDEAEKTDELIERISRARSGSKPEGH